MVGAGRVTADPAARSTRRRVEWRRVLAGQWGVAAFAALCMGCAWWFSARFGIRDLYADGRSHLTISRRIVDGSNRGFAQIGTVWLPLPHLLVAPFSLVTEWWRSGSAVLVVNAAALVAQALCVFRLVADATRRNSAGWVAVVALCANPAWLYLHVTALGEPVLFAAALAMVAGLASWARSDPPMSTGLTVIFCGVPAAAAVLSRYDGWAFAMAGAAFVAFVAQRRFGLWRYTLRCVRAFGVAPLTAALWWMWFNWVNWGDPLEFQRGRWSAQAQQQILDEAGLLPDKGDLGSSLATFFTATVRGTGVALAVAAALGMVVWAVTRRLRTDALALWLLALVPAGFYVLSLFTGQIALRLGGGDGSMFNLRYGLQMLPGVAVFAAVAFAAVARRRPPWGPAVAAVAAVAILAGTYVPAVWSWRDVPVVAEGLQQRRLADDLWRAAEFTSSVMRDDPSAVLLIDDSASPMLPVVAADLDRVVAPFDSQRFDAALEDFDGVDIVFADSGNGADSVAAAIEASDGFDEQFSEVFSAGDVAVYERVQR
jgi:hypothetical protein